MARILYGVMGNTNGHIMRTLSLVARLPEHEFRFVGGGKVPAAVAGRWPCLETPVPRTVHHRQRVSVSRTIGHLAKCHLALPRVTRQIAAEIEAWQPDLAICDREFFLPHAVRRTGLPCVSIDHSHVLKACRYPVPGPEKISWSLAMLNDYLFYDLTRHNLIVSFFHPPLKPSRPGFRDELFPAVVREVVTRRAPSPGEHIFVYQTSPTFHRLIATLGELKRPVVVYGFHNQDRQEGNISFRAYHPERILDDLAASAYAVVNGGHNLLSEALYYGKPVLCFPVRTLFEQFINAFHVRSLGYGDYATTLEPTPALFAAFEERLPAFRAAIAAGFREGTDQIVTRLRELIADPRLIVGS